MDMPDRFAMVAGRGIFRPAGLVSFNEAVNVVSAAIAAARDNGARDLLVNTTSLTGFATPDTLARFLMAVEWAAHAKGQLRLAVVTRAELIDPQKFGVTVAANRGLTADVFTAEAEAVAWLDAMCRAGK